MHINDISPKFNCASTVWCVIFKFWVQSEERETLLFSLYSYRFYMSSFLSIIFSRFINFVQNYKTDKINLQYVTVFAQSHCSLWRVHLLFDYVYIKTKNLQDFVLYFSTSYVDSSSLSDQWRIIAETPGETRKQIQGQIANLQVKQGHWN